MVFYHQIQGFPVNFPINQFYDWIVTMVKIQKAIENHHRNSGFSQLENVDFPQLCNKLPEGINAMVYYDMNILLAASDFILQSPQQHIMIIRTNQTQLLCGTINQQTHDDDDDDDDDEDDDDDDDDDDIAYEIKVLFLILFNAPIKNV